MKKFWETLEWLNAKEAALKTNEVLTRTEYVRIFGAKEYTEEKYQEYLRLMKQKVIQERLNDGKN